MNDVLKNLRRAGDRTFLMYIDGEWVSSSDGQSEELVDPGTGEILGSVTVGTTDDAERAIRAARRAFDQDGWPETSAQERARLLFKLADAIEAIAPELATLETLSNGKPLREAEFDVADAAGCFRYYAGLATKPHGQTFDVSAPSQSFVVREPVGVCGQIVPWNFPLLMCAWKLAPALAAGNVSVLKPASWTPLTALRLGTLIEQAGFPKGVVNILLGPGSSVGQYLAESPLVDMIALTGGTDTGRKVMKAAASNIKKVALELGGKSPNIVFADADFEVAVDYALYGIYVNAGQVCSAGSRLLVEASVHDRFVERLVERARQIRVGYGLDAETEMGPLVSAQHLEKVQSYIEVGQAEGARLLCGGKRPNGELGKRGNYLLPTIFTNTRPEMRIVQEEIFGPVLVIQTFKDEEDAVRIANDCAYGLAGAVFTQDISKAHRVIKKLRAGITWINTYHPTYNEAPWGGYKQSGIGRELGTFGYEEYTEVKQINVNLAVEPTGWFRH
ncbi:Aldehyde dehydrogenase family [Acididesulfobacillus acetoxydans]|uniref:Aldehyde dehydrogenase family n=1 Tax=Acididesulfobacillus acetoxydans TaxID=1561005 RepID=A0A8S0WIJ4_9FIRM|nr:aldehyde dehydrogenase family protein [Acididesulfobacillus acetoxydans]CAA7603392.1 Aldehyde dehydrogenase family [Acididesulfobacillus acetoxydans]CEJ08309.1 Betaine aldehyde dehydrogenase [Acididesulfobacillus acetoxydans]